MNLWLWFSIEIILIFSLSLEEKVEDYDKRRFIKHFMLPGNKS
jgi:hypothetical protein